VVFRQVVRGPPARRWAILEWCFARLYAPQRTRPRTGNFRGDEDSGDRTQETGLRACGPALSNLGVVFRQVVRATED